MPAIPVYSASPINAAKASGVTPKTASPEDAVASPKAPVTATSTSVNQSYPAAQPGARPSLPVQTGAPQPTSSIQPTPTQAVQDASPPAPRPGAVPAPPGATTGILPQQPPQTTAMPMPPQMSYPPPSAPYAPQGSTTTAPLYGGSRPTQLPTGGGPDSFAHPPGYHQNANASEFTSDQRAAHHASVAENSHFMPAADDVADEGVWGATKKWAAAAGGSLAAAEQEVWKRINKD